MGKLLKNPDNLTSAFDPIYYNSVQYIEPKSKILNKAMANRLYSILTQTNSLKVLGYLIENPGRELIEKEIQKATNISKGGVNLALRELAQKRLVERKRRGRMYFYTTQLNHPFIRQLKILKNIARLWPLVKELKAVSQKIILFGSWGRGENLKDSDIDLCILTNSAEEVQQIVKKAA